MNQRIKKHIKYFFIALASFIMVFFWIFVFQSIREKKEYYQYVGTLIEINEYDLTMSGERGLQIFEISEERMLLQSIDLEVVAVNDILIIYYEIIDEKNLVLSIEKKE